MANKDSFLVLDDQMVRLNAYRVRLAVPIAMGHRVLLTQSFDLALEEASREKFNVMFLDHDLGDETDINCIPTMYGSSSKSWTGDDFVRCLLKLHESMWPDQVIIHSWNEDGAHSMLMRLLEKGVRASCVRFSG